MAKRSPEYSTIYSSISTSKSIPMVDAQSMQFSDKNAIDINELNKSVMPVVTTEATKGNDFPEFDAFRQKYGLGSTFGFDKLPEFYNRASQLNDTEAKQDYQNVVGSIKNKIGTKALYGALNIPNQNIVDATAIAQQDKIQSISNAMQSLVKGEGAMAFLNPVGGIVGGIDEARKLAAESQNLMTGLKDASGKVIKEPDISGGLLKMLQGGASLAFSSLMATSPEGLGFTAGMGLLNATFPKQAEWLSPITKLTDPKTPSGQALAGLADVGLQFIGFGLVHSFRGLRDKVSPQTEKIIADKTDTQIKGLITGKKFEAGQTGEVGTRDLTKPQSPEIDKFISQQKLRHADLTNESNVKTQQLQKLTDSLKGTKGEIRTGLKKQIIDLRTSLEDINAERNAIDDAIRPYGGFTSSIEPQTKISGLLPQYASHTPVEGSGENIPSNINWSKAVNPDLIDRLTGGGRYGLTDIPSEQATPVMRGVTKPAVDEVLNNRKQVLESSLKDVPDEDKPVIQKEIDETQKALDNNAKPSQTFTEAQGSTISEKPTKDITPTEKVPPTASKEEISKSKGIISDEQYNKWKDDFNSLHTDISSNPYDFYVKQFGRLVGMGAYHFQNGAIRFADWSKKMINDLGEDVKPHLIAIWNQIKNDPSLTQIAKQPESFNPNEQKFLSTESSSKTVSKIANTLKGATDWVEGIFQPAFPAIRKFGDDPYANVMRGIHLADVGKLQFDNAKSEIFDVNFKAVEDFFNKFSKKDIDLFNRLRGDAKFAFGQKIQGEARARFSDLPKELQNPKLMNSIREISDWIHNWAKENNMPLDYMEDYFYGSFKSAKNVGKFLDYWKTTDKYTKQKMLPTIADAVGWGELSHQVMELKNPNPITNLREEMLAISRRIGMKNINDYNENTNAPYMVSMDKATPEQYAHMEKINDPVFTGKLFDPVYARFVNSMIEVNKISHSPLLSSLKTISYGLQLIKFAGSMFHMVNMVKHAVASENGGIFNYKGVVNFAEAFKKYDVNDPLYQDYVALGGGHQYSLESSAQRLMTNSLSSLGEKIGVGDGLKKLYGQTKFIPISPEFVKWMFDSYIPTLKFNRWKLDIAKLGRDNVDVTDGQKIAQIRKIQQFYGEMNERLYGRSGTVTSAMRLIFLAPGYGEGNFRTTLSSLDAWGAIKGVGEHRDNIKYVVNSLITSATLATMGTLVLTGKLPNIPKTLPDVRDLFKIKTGAQDKDGNDLYIDMMTYDKDFWALYGDALTGQPGNIPTDIMSRISYATSPGLKTLTDLSELFQGKQIVDYKNDPIYSPSDSFLGKLSKFLSYEGQQAMPISLSVLGESLDKGASVKNAILTSIVGIRPVYSEHTKLVRKTTSDVFGMIKAKESEQYKLNAMGVDDPDKALQEQQVFNERQIKKLDELSKKTGVPIGDYDKFTINYVTPRQPETSEERLQNIWSKPLRRRSVGR